LPNMSYATPNRGTIPLKSVGTREFSTPLSPGNARPAMAPGNVVDWWPGINVEENPVGWYHWNGNSYRTPRLNVSFDVARQSSCAYVKIEWLIPACTSGLRAVTEFNSPIASSAMATPLKVELKESVPG